MTDLPPARVDVRVTTVSLTVEARPDGKYRISSPHARGWAAVVSNARELVAAITRDAFTEVSVASYARAHNTHYDLDMMTERVHGDPLAGKPAPRKRSTGSERVHSSYHPVAWTKMEDGRWKSPAGRMYGPNTRQVQNMVRRRLAQGLSI